MWHRWCIGGYSFEIHDKLKWWKCNYLICFASYGMLLQTFACASAFLPRLLSSWPPLNSCYMNAVMQVMFSLPVFAQRWELHGDFWKQWKYIMCNTHTRTHLTSLQVLWSCRGYLHVSSTWCRFSGRLWSPDVRIYTPTPLHTITPPTLLELGASWVVGCFQVCILRSLCLNPMKTRISQK